MAEREKYAWASLGATVLVYLYFQMRMMDGWAIVGASPRQMIGTYVTVIIMAIIAEIIIAAILAGARKGKIALADERDLAITAKAHRNEGYFGLAAINIVIIHVLAEDAYPGHIFPSIDLTTVPAIFFVLFSTLFLGHFVNLISTIVYYRR